MEVGSASLGLRQPRGGLGLAVDEQHRARGDGLQIVNRGDFPGVNPGPQAVERQDGAFVEAHGRGIALRRSEQRPQVGKAPVAHHRPDFGTAGSQIEGAGAPHGEAHRPDAPGLHLGTGEEKIQGGLAVVALAVALGHGGRRAGAGPRIHLKDAVPGLDQKGRRREALAQRAIHAAKSDDRGPVLRGVVPHPDFNPVRSREPALLRKGQSLQGDGVPARRMRHSGDQHPRQGKIKGRQDGSEKGEEEQSPTQGAPGQWNFRGGSGCIGFHNA